jgi:hypothetical protein
MIATIALATLILVGAGLGIINAALSGIGTVLLPVIGNPAVRQLDDGKLRIVDAALLVLRLTMLGLVMHWFEVIAAVNLLPKQPAVTIMTGSCSMFVALLVVAFCYSSGLLRWIWPGMADRIETLMEKIFDSILA